MRGRTSPDDGKLLARRPVLGASTLGIASLLLPAASHAASGDEDTAANPTRNLDAPRSPRGDERIAAAIEELTARGPLPGQTGVLVSHGERMVGADLFGNPELLAEMWAGLVRSYYANAPERIYGRPSSTLALRFIRYFLTRPAERIEGVAIGQEHRVTTGGVLGTGLMAGDRLIHASCFARAA